MDPTMLGRHVNRHEQRDNMQQWTFYLCVALALVTQCSLQVAAASEVVQLRGAGASFPSAVYKQWILLYQRIRDISLNMIYDAVGSGAGKARIEGYGDPVEYAGSDSILSENEYLTHQDLQMFPTMAGAVVLAYHLPNNPQINLKRQHVVGIYNGTITWWNDTEIAIANPGITLPNSKIIVLARSDKSGTTDVFTRTLSAFSSEWNATYGSFSVGLDNYVPVHWNPNAISFYGNTNTGMAGLLVSIRYSLGYLSAADAVSFSLQSARIFNKDDVLVEANVTTIQSAMDAFSAGFTSKMTLSIVDAPGRSSYPISSFTYLIIYKTTMKDCRSATALYRYIEWFLTSSTARNTTIAKGMVPLSTAVATRIFDQVLNEFSCKGRSVKELVEEEIYMEIFAAQTWRTPLFIALPIAIFLLLLFVAYIVYHQVKLNKAILLKEYIIPSSSIVIMKNINAKSVVSVDSSITGHTRSAGSLAEKKSSRKSQANHDHPESLMFGQWNGELVNIQTITIIKDPKELRHRTKRLLLWMRDTVNHLNVVNFYGISDFDKKTQLISLYCTKGTLQDVIHSERFNLDDNFKYTMAMDIAMGMDYLHQNHVIHGFLSTATCYIDSRWTIKVGDWQYTKLVASQDIITRSGVLGELSDVDSGGTDENMIANHLFWTAPEILADRYLPPTKYSDVYSFSMAVIELFVRKHPFDEALSKKEPKKIIKDIYQGDYRPELGSEMPKRMVSILTACWSPEPAGRPQFSKVIKMVKQANPNRKSLLDCMMEELEKYVDHLEDKVNERTIELNAALKQVEELLHKILPASVAESLSRGESVSPEAFGSVTIYFSDIVGFTTIAAESSPLEIVDFLNDLYTTFDAVIEAHDVYKVETIGDAYMCISGLPTRNGKMHASHIANMSLDIAVACGSFKVKHRPEEMLRIRIGVNSGSVVAGVVGNKMPRYCLFGDAVNTASRMETNSRPMKIHLSSSTKKVLDTIGGYEIRRRGNMEIKGKGSMQTYWLVGKRGYDKKLPVQTTMREHDDDPIGNHESNDSLPSVDGM